MSDVSQICFLLCGQKKCEEDVNLCLGKCSKVCIELGKSIINNLNENQIEYILSSIEEHIFLDACPGSGKTEVLAIKAVCEIKKWNKQSKKIAVLTFTNSAEDEIKLRINKYLGSNIQNICYVGTFTSWLHGYIANPFLVNWRASKNGLDLSNIKDRSIKLIDEECNSNFLESFSTKYQYKDKKGNLKYNKIKSNEFSLYKKGDKTIFTGKNIKKYIQNMDTKYIQDLLTKKVQFWNKGFSNYEDVEYLVLDLLKKSADICKLISQKFPVIFIDECQDLSYIQLQILKVLANNGTKIHLIGDKNQSIYEFRDIDIKDLDNFIKGLRFNRIELNKNYRSTQDIIDLSNYVVNESKIIKSCNKNLFPSKSLYAILYNENEYDKLINKFNELVEQENLNKGNSRIIVRSNSLKNSILGINKNDMNMLEELAMAIFWLKNKNIKVNNFKFCIEIIAKNIQKIFFAEIPHQNKINLYQPDVLEKDDWIDILVKVKDKFILEKELHNFNLTWSSWKKILKKCLENLSREIKILNNIEPKLGNVRNNCVNKIVNEDLFKKDANTLGYRIETIHSCKGMSLDSVLFISSKDRHSENAYWEDWFNIDKIEEKNRFAYVAFSRAKYILCLGIQNKNKINLRKLIELGIEVIDITQ